MLLAFHCEECSALNICLEDAPDADPPVFFFQTLLTFHAVYILEMFVHAKSLEVFPSTIVLLSSRSIGIKRQMEEMSSV